MTSKPTNAELDTNLKNIKKWMKNNNKHHKHTKWNEISTSLVWIATNHPELLEDDSKELQKISVEHLHISDSWSWMSELIPTEALITIFESSVCKDLLSFGGYVNAEVVKLIPHTVSTIRLALGDLIDNCTLLEELRSRYEKQLDNKTKELLAQYGSIIINLDCGKLKLEDLSELPDFNPKVYISNSSDAHTSWIVKAVTALQPKNSQEPGIKEVYLPQSKLTKSGIEAIAKGLSEAFITLDTLEISSYSIETKMTPITGSKFSDDESDEDSDGDSDDYSDWDSDKDMRKETKKFCRMICKKYGFESVSFTDERGMKFANIFNIPIDINQLVRELRGEIMAEIPDAKYYYQ